MSKNNIFRLNEDGINIIVENTFKRIGNVDGNKISFDEYCNFVSLAENHRILAPFSLDINKLIQYEAASRRLRKYSLSSMNLKKLHHGPLATDSENKTVRQFFPSMIFGDKIERVSSIHDPTAICADFN